MEFRILGPLEAAAASEPIRLGGRKEQLVLAALIVSAGQVVSADRLVDAMWGEEPPSTALKTLRSHMSRIRARLKPWGAPIETTAHGYVLNPSGISIDAEQFESLLSEARERRKRNDHAGAVTTLERALGLWRGRALAGLEDADFARNEAARLDELRFEALEARIDSQLALGQHTAVVAELESLVEQHPLREGLWAALMKALARSGRQADALRAFQRAKARLGAELGIEPSPELRAVEEAILLQQEEAPFKASFLTAPPEPRTSFIGREEESDQVLAILTERRHVTITGTGGSGKTRLAIETVKAMSADYEDGVVFVDLAPVSEADQVPDQLAMALGDVGSHAEDITATIVEYLAPLEMLLVFDNCEHLAPSAASLIETLLAGCPRLAMLITSREPVGLTDEAIFRIPPLELPDPDAPPAEQDEAASMRLYVDRVRAFDRGFQVGEDNRAAVVAVCLALDGIPLALELAAARTRAIAPKELAARMADRFAALDAGLPGAPRHQQTLRATIDWSYELCSESEKSALRRSSVFAGGFTLDSAEVVLSAPSIERREVAGLLAALVDRSLVEQTPVRGASRYRLLETVRQYASEALAASGEETAMQALHCDWYTALAEEAEPALRGPDQVSWWERLEPELDNFRGAIAWSLGTEDPSSGFRLVAALGWFWFQRGLWREAWRWVRRCVELEKDVDPLLRARVVWAAGCIEVIRGKLDPLLPLLEEAIESCRAAGDRLGEAWSLHYRGHALGWTGADEAEGLMREALDIFEELGDPWGEAWSWRYIGQVLEDRDMGLDLHIRALNRFFELGDRWCAAYSLYLIGAVYLSLGRVEEADDSQHKALEIATELGDTIWSTHAAGRLGMAAYYREDDAEADDLLTRGVEMHRRIGDENCAAILLGYRGMLAARRRAWAEAEEHLAGSLRLWKRLGSEAYLAGTLAWFAGVVTDSGSPSEGAILFGASKESPSIDRLVSTKTRYAEGIERLESLLPKELGRDEYERLMGSGAELGVEAAAERAMARVAVRE